MKKSVVVLSGAMLALLLSAGQSMAGGPSLTTTLTTSKTTIYQNETLTLHATLQGAGNSSSCATGAQKTLYKNDVGTTFCDKDFSGTQTGPFAWEYTAEPCPVRGSDLLVGSNNLKAEVSGGYCSNIPGQTADQVHVTVLAGNAPIPAAIPTTSEWTLWGLTGLLLIGGGVFVSRRFRATTA